MHLRLLTVVILVSALDVSPMWFGEESEDIKGCESKTEGPDELDGSAGEQLSLLTVENEKLTLDEKNLTKLLCRKDVKDKHVAVISIAGAFRMGKSFTMNLFLRYFQQNAEKGWLSKYPKASLDDGISWRGGSKRHTVGIIAWSKPFVVQRADGSKMAVILLDTQGNFDHESTKEISIRIFALSTLFSSLQIFNVMRQIQANDLEHLQTFVEYSKFPRHIHEYSGDQRTEFETMKHFQDLLFLVRDWSNPDENPYGRKGGTEYFKDLEMESGKNRGSFQQYLYNAFKNIDCYLMPEPPRKVRKANASDRSLLVEDLGDEFATHVENLADEFIHPHKLAHKIIIGDSEMNGNDLFKHVKHCAKVLLSGDGPVMKNEMEIIAQYNSLLQREKLIENYEQSVLKALETAETWQDYDDILKKHKEEAKYKFLKATWYGKGTEDETVALLTEKFRGKDAYLKEIMGNKRGTIAESEIKVWREKYNKLLEGRNILFTPVSNLDIIYSEALENIFQGNDRDPKFVKDKIEAAKHEMGQSFEMNKRNLEDRNNWIILAISVFFACGILLRIAPLFVGILVASAGSMLYYYRSE